MYSHRQSVALVLAALIAVATCTPSPSTPSERSDVAEGRAKGLTKGLKGAWKLLVFKQVFPYIVTAFFNTMVATVINWFYPTRVVPPPPGKLGVAQLIGSIPPPVPYWRR